MENDFSAELLAADAGKFGGDFWDGVIGDAYQDGSGGESVVGDSREWLTGADELGGLAGRGIRVRGDNKNAPAAFMQQAAQRAPYAASTENGEGLRHPC